MARVRLLDLVKPFAPLLPEVQFAYQKVAPFDRIAYTVAAGLVYVLLAEVSVWGVTDQADPIAWLRAPLAMSRGTLAEFGIVPVVVAGFGFQVAAAQRRLRVSLDIRSDRVLFQTAQKLAAILLTAVLALVATFAGGYERSGNPAIVWLQFFLGGVVVIYLDEVLSKGYGFVPGALLFSSVRVAQHLMWSALSVANVTPEGTSGTTPYGVIPAFVGGLRSRSLPFTLSQTAFRAGLPNALGFAIAMAVFLGVVYLSLLRVNLQIRMTKMRGQSQQFPVRLLYTGPVATVAALAWLALLLTASFALSSVLGAANPVARVLGAWDGATPVAGLVQLLVPGAGGPLLYLPRVVVYTLLLAFASARAGAAWTASSGFAPQDLAKAFKENAIVLVGKRDVTVLRELRAVIPPAATLGAALSGLAAAADVWGPSGLGAAAAVAALDAFAMVETIMQETGGELEGMTL